MTFEIGSTAYIVESNRIIREVTIVKRNGDFYIIRFGTRGGIQVRSNRLFASYEDADSSIHKKIEKRTGYSGSVVKTKIQAFYNEPISVAELGRCPR